MAEAARIHPTAIVDRGADLAAGVVIGPYSLIGPHVTIGPGSELGAHVVLEGRVRLGAGGEHRGDQRRRLRASGRQFRGLRAHQLDTANSSPRQLQHPLGDVDTHHPRSPRG